MISGVRNAFTAGTTRLTKSPSKTLFLTLSNIIPKQLAVMIPLPPQRSQYDAAYRKGFARGQAMCDPNRRITIIVTTFSPTGAALGYPTTVLLSTKQGATIDSVVSAIHSRLPPDMPSLVTIFPRGAESRVLEAGNQTAISSLLPSYDATGLHLHLEIELPEPRAEKSQQTNEAQKGQGRLRAKLRKICGLYDRQSGRNDREDSNETFGVHVGFQGPSSEQNDELLPPPSYHEAMAGNS